MKKSIIAALDTILVLALAAFAGCRKPSPLFTMDGTVGPSHADSIYVIGTDSRFDRIDTIRPVDGRFHYECSLDTVTPLLLLYTDGTTDIVFADKGLHVTFSRADADSRGTVTGGHYNEEYNLFLSQLDTIPYQDSIGLLINHIDSFIERDPYSEVTPYLLYRYAQLPGFSKSHITRLTEKMSGSMLDNPLVADVRSRYISDIAFNGILVSSDIFDTEQHRVRVNTLCSKGHLLVCFWASWDEQSRQALRELQQLLDKYSDMEFSVAGLSIDTNSARWLDAVNADSLDWPQYNDPAGWNGRVAEQIELNTLPYYMVIAQQGRVVSRSSDLSVIEKRLPELLQKKQGTRLRW